MFALPLVVLPQKLQQIRRYGECAAAALGLRSALPGLAFYLGVLLRDRQGFVLPVNISPPQRFAFGLAQPQAAVQVGQPREWVAIVGCQECRTLTLCECDGFSALNHWCLRFLERIAFDVLQV